MVAWCQIENINKNIKQLSYLKACNPVIPLPNIRAWISCVPIYNNVLLLKPLIIIIYLHKYLLLLNSSHDVSHDIHPIYHYLISNYIVISILLSVYSIPPSISRANLAASSDLTQEFLFNNDIISGTTL